MVFLSKDLLAGNQTGTSLAMVVCYCSHTLSTRGELRRSSGRRGRCRGGDADRKSRMSFQTKVPNGAILWLRIALCVVGGTLNTAEAARTNLEWQPLTSAVIFLMVIFSERCPECHRLLWRHRSGGTYNPFLILLTGFRGCPDRKRETNKSFVALTMST